MDGGAQQPRTTADDVDAVIAMVLAGARGEAGSREASPAHGERSVTFDLGSLLDAVGDVSPVPRAAPDRSTAAAAPTAALSPSVSPALSSSSSAPAEVSDPPRGSNPVARLEMECRALRALLRQANASAAVHTQQLADELERRAADAAEAEAQYVGAIDAMRCRAERAEDRAAAATAALTQLRDEMAVLRKERDTAVAESARGDAAAALEVQRATEDAAALRDALERARDACTGLRTQLSAARAREARLLEELRLAGDAAESQRQRAESLVGVVRSKEAALEDVATFVTETLAPFVAEAGVVGLPTVKAR